MPNSDPEGKTDDMSESSPELVCARYRNAAEKSHGKVLHLQKIPKFINGITSISEGHIGPTAIRKLLTEIDTALWSGEITLEEIVLELYEWLDLCGTHGFHSLYVHHAVPEVFGQKREFAEFLATGETSEYRILVTSKNMMSEQHVPCVIMVAYLIIPGKSPYKIMDYEGLTIGQGPRNALHFFEDLPMLAQLEMETRKKIANGAVYD